MLSWRATVSGVSNSIVIASLSIALIPADPVPHGLPFLLCLLPCFVLLDCLAHARHPQQLRMLSPPVIAPAADHGDQILSRQRLAVWRGVSSAVAVGAWRGVECSAIFAAPVAFRARTVIWRHPFRL
ncbi:hypothetical protein FLM52_14705 [bacterium Scap17]|nr:hypothetical protein [bacterium Scap17]